MQYGVKVVGHVETQKEQAYLLEDGRNVTFHTAKGPKGTLSVFYTPLNVWPSITASKLGIEYTLLRNSTQEEVRAEVAASSIKVIGVTDI